MGIAIAFSTLTLLSLFVYFIYFLRRYLPCFIRESTLFNHVVIIATFLEWAWDFCLCYSLVPFNHYVAEVGAGAVQRADNHDELQREDDAGMDCPLCMYEVEEGEEICELICGHVFHRFCLEIWARYTNPGCPFCQRPPELTGRLVSEIYRRSLPL